MIYSDDRTIRFGNRFTTLTLRLENGVPLCVSVRGADGFAWENPARRVPLVAVPGFSFEDSTVCLEEFTDDRGGLSERADCLRITFEKDGRAVGVLLRTYPDNPFITLSLTLRGTFGRTPEAARVQEESGVENGRRPEKLTAAEAFSCPVSEKHLKLESVTLSDVTDANNILVRSEKTTVYPARPCEARGQIFFLDAYLAAETLMLVKEAPCAAGRIVPEAFDVRVEAAGRAAVGGLGCDFSRAAEYTPDVPLSGASFAAGRRSELERAWRAYYRRDMAATAARGLVMMSNTWGDRNQDAAVCERFMLGEIACAERLGVGAVQIDDGWEHGRTANSKLARSAAWGSGYYAADPDFWRPDTEKFPHGLETIREAARKAELLLGLWFSPDLANDYENWELDAETLLGLHRQAGVRFFKLDGINLTSKRAETRLAAMVRRVHEASGGAVTFNFDITAQRRWGYLPFREYGTLFVENRYTDWGNYHPHSTLRTVWMLSRYIPTARLQMEFLNLRRNPQKYENDPLAPQRYGIDWAFAAVMFANPLCWMEMSSLPEEDAALLSRIVSVWRPLAAELAHADVTPLGEEPDGLSFTGLRAECGICSYLLLFRENGAEKEYTFRLPAAPGKLSVLYASGGASASLCAEGVRFSAPEERSFVLLRTE